MAASHTKDYLPSSIRFLCTSGGFSRCGADGPSTLRLMGKAISAANLWVVGSAAAPNAPHHSGRSDAHAHRQIRKAVYPCGTLGGWTRVSMHDVGPRSRSQVRSNFADTPLERCQRAPGFAERRGQNSRTQPTHPLTPTPGSDTGSLEGDLNCWRPRIPTWTVLGPREPVL